jgi:hypothetical protein
MATEDGRGVDKADTGCGTGDSIGSKGRFVVEGGHDETDETERSRRKRKVRYRRLKKNAHGLIVACVLANLLMAAPTLLPLKET